MAFMNLPQMQVAVAELRIGQAFFYVFIFSGAHFKLS